MIATNELRWITRKRPLDPGDAQLFKAFGWPTSTEETVLQQLWPTGVGRIGAQWRDVPVEVET